MRTLTFAMMSAALALGAAGPAGALAPASGTIELRATATFSDGSSADRLYEVKSDADSDGDGINDSGWLRVACDGAVTTKVYYTVESPRDMATGQSSGKRMHKPFTIIKEWGPPPPMLGQSGGGGGGGAVGSSVIGSRASWDLAKGKGARSTSSGPVRGDHSGASDASAGKGAKDGAKPSVATYDLKKLEGGRTAGVGQTKTMASDSWHEAKLTEGSPNLCS